MAKKEVNTGMLPLAVQQGFEGQKVPGSTTDGLGIITDLQQQLDADGSPITTAEEFAEAHKTADDAEAILGKSVAPKDDADSKIIKLPKKD